MEQIRKEDGVYYYGNSACQTVDEAYQRFREEYHKSLGKQFYYRLNQLGRRTERLNGFGFVRSKGIQPPEWYKAGVVPCGRVPYYILGLVGIHYCRITGARFFPDTDEDRFWELFEWAFTRGSGVLKRVGTRDNAGRKSKILKKRYR